MMKIIQSKMNAVSIWCPHNSCRCCNSLCIAYLCAKWGGLHDHLRDGPWRNIFKIYASAAASELCEWIQFGIDFFQPLGS